MKISTSQVTKLAITDLANMDPISVMVEDFGPGAGKITITSAGEAWSSYWSHMGEQHTLRSFFLKCNTPYLVGKLKTGIRSRIPDEDDGVLTAHLCKRIIERRRKGDLKREEARNLWDDAGQVIFGEHADLCWHVFGAEWWEGMPKKVNPDYEWLAEIVDTVKAAFKLEAEGVPA